MIDILLQKILDLLTGYFTSIKNKLTYLYENIDNDKRNAQQLFIIDELIPDSYIKNDGELAEYEGRSATDFIDVRPYNGVIFFNGITNLDYTCQYNENKEKIGGMSLRIGKNTYSPTVAYIRTSGTSTPLNSGNFKIWGEYSD